MGEIDEKFMFDMNVFDDGHVDEDEDLPPPPPTFSEAELADAKQQSFKEGEAKAAKEAQESIEKAVSDTLAKIENEIPVLFKEEEARAKLYEQEALNLTLHIFKSLFPHYQEAHGFDELKAFLSDTFEKNRPQSVINIHVAPHIKDGVDKAIEKIAAQNPDMHFDVLSDDTLNNTSCRLSWKEGGGLFKAAQIAQEVEAILKQTLEQDGFTSHDNTPHDENQTNEQKSDIVEEELDSSNEVVTEEEPDE